MTAELLDCTPQEQEWLEGCRREDPKAQEMVFKHYYGLVYGICIRYLSSKELSQEVVNDCFLKLFRQFRSTYHHPDYFRRWLRQLTVHTAIDAYRKEKPYLQDSAIDDLVIDIGHQECINDRLNAEHILSLLALLPELWRLTFNLYEVEGYAHEEIAELLTIPVSSSRVYLTRAKQRLRELLRQHNSVRTYMPIQYTSSVNRQEDPDWAHFRKTLRSYEPIGDPNAWSRFQRGTRPPKQRHWYTLMLLTAVAIVCEKSQHGVPHWLHTQAVSQPVKTGTIVPWNSQKKQKFDVEKKRKQPVSQPAKTDSAKFELVVPAARIGKDDAIAPSSLALVPADTQPYTATSIEKGVNYTAKSADRVAYKIKESLPATNVLRPLRKEKIPTQTAATSVSQAWHSRRRVSVFPVNDRLMDNSRFDYQENRWIGAVKKRSTAKIPPNSREPLSDAFKISESGGRLTETISASDGLFRLPINKLAARPLSLNRKSANIPVRVLALPQVSSSPTSASVERPLSIGAMVGIQAAYIPQGKPTLGITSGVWVDKMLTRKLFFGTGLTLSQTQVIQVGNGLVSQDSVTRRELLQRDTQWWQITLPLSIRYTFVDTKRVSWWGEIGVSSALVFGEKRTSQYQVTSANPKPADSTQQVKSYTEQVMQRAATSVLLQPFRWLTLSTGLRMATTGKYEWWTEPYFSYPIGEITTEALKVSMAGIRLRIRQTR